MVRTFEPTNIHTAKLIDLPLMRRLTDSGVLLDTELVCTRAALGTGDVLLSSVLPQRGVYTLVGRSGRDKKVIGQFRLRADAPVAHMIFVAPGGLGEGEDGTLLHLLDAVAVEAGRHGAHMLMAEVDENSPLFETLRVANFAVYSRQTIWRYEGEGYTGTAAAIDDITDADRDAIAGLYASVVPPLIQPVAAPSEESGGWLYRRPGTDGRLRAHIAFASGRSGGYLLPFVAHDVAGPEAEALFAAVVARARSAERGALFLGLRRYQEWLDTALVALGFVPAKEQAVMVRHIAAGVRHAQFALNPAIIEGLPRAMRPPSRSTLRLNHMRFNQPCATPAPLELTLVEEQC